MAPTITNETTSATTTPLLITPWETQQESGAIVRGLLNNDETYVTLGTATRRKGNLTAVYNDEAEADAARLMLSAAGTFTLDYPERSSIEMRFVVVDEISVRFTRPRYWAVSFAYQEIAP